MKQIEAAIMGQTYLLAAPHASEERMLQAIERVDAAMCQIRDAGKIKARERIAVLAALNLAFEQTEPAENVPEGARATALALKEQASLRALLRRLDEALGEDGRLI